MIDPAFGLEVHQHPVGTVIRDEATGEEFEVTNEQAVRRGRELHVSPAMYAALKAHPDIKDTR